MTLRQMLDVGRSWLRAFMASRPRAVRPSRAESLAWAAVVVSALVAATSFVTSVSSLIALPILLGAASGGLGVRHAYRLGLPAGDSRGPALFRDLVWPLDRNRVGLLLVTGALVFGCWFAGGDGPAVMRVHGVPRINNHGAGPVISEARYRREQARASRSATTITWLASALALMLLAQADRPDEGDV